MATRFTEMLSAEPADLTHPHLSVSLDDTLAQQRAYDMMHARSQPRSASGSSTASTTSTSSRNSTLPTNHSSTHLSAATNSNRTGSTSSFSSSNGDDALLGPAPIEARSVKVWGSCSDADQHASTYAARSGPMGSVAGVVGVTNVANRLRKKALGRRNS